MNASILSVPAPTTPIVSAPTAHAKVNEEGAVLLDVRGYDEFASGHADGAICMPLPDLERRAGEIPTDRPAMVMCQQGGRSALAAERLRALGMNNIIDVEGGYAAWKKAGLPTISHSQAMPLERQVRIAAGAFVLAFSLAGYLINSAFFMGTALVGFMLAFTGILGICPMMAVLKLLPCNRVSPACTK